MREGADHRPPRPVDLGRPLISIRAHVLEEINARRVKEGKPPIDKFGIEHGADVIVSEDDDGALEFDIVLTLKPQPAPPPTITCEICGADGAERAKNIFKTLKVCWFCASGARLWPASLTAAVKDPRDRRVVGAVCEAIHRLRFPGMAFVRSWRGR